MKLFFVWPATLPAARVIIKPTTGPKKPMIEYPTTGAAGRYPHSDFQMMIKPAMTGRQQVIRSGIRMLRWEHIQPVTVMPTALMAPSGN